MKKIIFSIIALVMVIFLAVIPAFATEAETDGITDGSTDGVTDGETIETVEESAELTETGDDTETETEDIAAIIGGAESRVDAIVKLAGAMGITLEEAEALLDKMISLGDEHFGESDLWGKIKASIEEDPEAWTVVALVVLMLVALTIFIIRGLIKNTSAQAATKANIIDIKKNEAEISESVSKATSKLAEIDRDHNDIKLEMSEIRALAVGMSKMVDENKAVVNEISEMAVVMLSAVDLLKTNSESALNVNIEQALQTVQLLNIALGRQMPNVSDSTRRVWYEDAVARIKSAAGMNEKKDTEK